MPYNFLYFAFQSPIFFSTQPPKSHIFFYLAFKAPQFPLFSLPKPYIFLHLASKAPIFFHLASKAPYFHLLSLQRPLFSFRIHSSYLIIKSIAPFHTFWGHSITTWTRRGGEGVSQVFTIVHAREGGGLGNVHVDNFFGKMCLFCS